MNFRNLLLILVMFAAILLRLVPHPSNFTPILAIGLFGGFYFRNNKMLGLLIVLAGMCLSDYYIGVYDWRLMFFVYIGLIPSVLIGFMIPNEKYTTSFDNVLWSGLASSIIFFVLSNFGVFLIGYPKSISGFIACYTAAIPFFANTMSSTLIFSTAMFLCFDALKNSIPKLNSDIA